jgi:hypothetical protein
VDELQTEGYRTPRGEEQRDEAAYSRESNHAVLILTLPPRLLLKG